MTIGAGNVFVLANTNHAIRFTLISGSGLVRGDFFHPETGKKTAMRGAVHQKRDAAGGAFGGTNQSGYFSLPPP